jgi:hypothetical protein
MNKIQNLVLFHVKFLLRNDYFTLARVRKVIYLVAVVD